MEVNIISVLHFFDEKPPNSCGQDAIAINAIAGEELGIGLLAHYLRQQGAKVEVLPEPCTQGTRKGNRLDKWINATKDGNTVYYQVEVKNWSSHSFGGRVLKIQASADEVRAHKINRWQRQWDGNTFKAKEMNKVLIPMRPPKSGYKVEPIACYWDAMHPEGMEEPFFYMTIENQSFPGVWVFSMSAYLRELLKNGVSKVVLDMPSYKNSLAWLNKLFQ